jgi:hypothetical protein
MCHLVRCLLMDPRGESCSCWNNLKLNLGHVSLLVLHDCFCRNVRVLLVPGLHLDGAQHLQMDRMDSTDQRQLICSAIDYRIVAVGITMITSICGCHGDFFFTIPVRVTYSALPRLNFCLRPAGTRLSSPNPILLFDTVLMLFATWVLNSSPVSSEPDHSRFCELVSNPDLFRSISSVTSGATLGFRLQIPLVREKYLRGERRVRIGFMLGTLAQMIPVPTSTTDQLRLETQA